MPAELLSVHEASRQYGKDRRTIQRKIARGELTKRTMKNGEIGIAVHDLETAFGAHVQGGGAPLAASQTPPAAPLAAGGRRAASGAITQDSHPLEIVVARLEASLELERQRRVDLEEARQREVAKQNDHIDTLRTQLDEANARAAAAHQESQNLHRQLADARRHETARLAPPSPMGNVINGDPAGDKPSERHNARTTKSSNISEPATTPKPEARTWWLARIIGRK